MREDMLYIYNESCNGASDIDIKGNMTNKLTLNNTANLTVYACVLATVRYDNMADILNSTFPRTVTFTVNDGQSHNSSATTTVNLMEFFDPPRLFPNGKSLSFNTSFDEATASPVPLVNVSGWTLVDDDSTQLHNGTISIVNVDAMNDVLNVTKPDPAIEANYNATTGVLSLNGIAAVSKYEALIGNVTFYNLNKCFKKPETRTISLVVRDDRNRSSSLATTWISIVPFNDPPELSLNGLTTLTYTFTRNGDRPDLMLANMVEIVDCDNDTLDNVKVTIAQAGDSTSGEETLMFDNSGTDVVVSSSSIVDFALSYNLTNGTSVDEFQRVLRTVVYKNTADIPAGNPRDITITISDGSNSVSSTIRLTMDQQPSKPIVKLGDGDDAVYREDGEALAFLNITGVDVMPGDTDFLLSATLTVTNPKNELDELRFSGDLGSEASVSGQNSSILTITVNGFSNVLDSKLEEWLKMVTFRSYDQAPNYARNISVVVKDFPLQRSSAPLFVVVQIEAVNDQPVVTEPPLMKSVTLKDYLPQTVNNPGYRIDTIINGSVVTDVDEVDPVGIAIISESQSDGLVGRWQYWINDLWKNFSSPTDCGPLFLLPSTSVRFKPFASSSKADGTATFEYRVWDNSSKSVCDNGSLPLTETSPVSIKTENFSVGVVYSNHAPTIDANLIANFTFIDEDLDEAENDGDVVSAVVSQVAADADDAKEDVGAAVIWVGNENGVWQYRVKKNETWTNIPTAVNTTRAFLIAPLSYIRFLPDLNEFGRRSIRFKAWDGSESSQRNFVNTTASDRHSGSFSFNNATAGIEVKSVNDAPVVDVSNVSRRVYRENGKAVSVFSNQLAISDVDSKTLSSVTVTLTRSKLSGGDCKGIPSETDSGSGEGPGLSNSSSSSTGDCSGTHSDSIESDCLSFTGSTSGLDITFTYTDTLTVLVKAKWNNISRSRFVDFFNTMEFSNTANETTNVNRSITVTASDGKNTSKEATVIMQVELVNDNSPILSVPSNSLEFIEDSKMTSLFMSNPTITDDDCNEIFFIKNARITLSGYQDSTKENVTSTNVSDSGTVVQTWNSTSGVLEITGNASVSRYQTILGSLVYYNEVSEPNGDNRNVTIWVFDGQFMSNVEVVTISVVLINDQTPVLLLDADNMAVNTTAVFTENNTVAVGVNVAKRVTLVDPDSIYTRPVCDIINIENPRNPSKEMIYLESGPVGSVTNQSTNHRITLIAGDSLSEIAETFQRVRYINKAEEPDPTPRVICFQVIDMQTNAGNVTVTACSNITVSLVNDPPQLTLEGDVVKYAEGDPPVDVLPNVTVRDVDNKSLSIGYIYFKVSNGSVFEPGQDLLVLDTSNTLVTENYNESLGIATLSGPASLDDFQTVLRRLTYKYATAKGDPVQGDREIRCVVNDGLVNSTVAIVTVDFTTVNNRPVLFLGGTSDKRNVTVTFTEEKGFIGVVEDSVTLTDPDNTELSHVIVNLTNADKAEYLTAIKSGGVNVTGNRTSVLRLDGPATTGDFINVLKTVMYNNTDDEPLMQTRVVEFTASDGDRISELVTSTIRIAFVNDRPRLDLNGSAVGTGSSVTFVENGPPVSLATFNVSVKDDDNSTMTQVQVILANVLDGADETINHNANLLNVTSSVQNDTYTYDFDPPASLSEVEQFIADLTYNNAADEPSLGDRRANVSVYDGKHHSNVAAAIISIQPVNDETPTFDQTLYNANVTEEAKSAQVVSVTATDADADDHNMKTTITYEISSSNCSGSFVLNSTSGEIRTSDSTPPDRDRDMMDYCTINVTATDGELNGTATVVVRIVDINDNDPTFVSYPKTDVNVSESREVGVEVFNVSATDIDAGDNGRIEYSIRPPSLFFNISSDGSVRIVQSLDFEYKRKFNVPIIARDFGNSPRSSNVTVVVVIVNVNEHPPVFDPVDYSSTLCETPDTNVTVVTVKATDMDDGSFGFVTYELDHTIFTVHITSGRVYNMKPLDFEASKSYELTVTAKDGGDKTANATVFVYIHNENDNSPVFSTSKIVNVSENETVGKVFYSSLATDNDKCVYDQCDNGESIDCEDRCMSESMAPFSGSASGSGCQPALLNTLSYSLINSSDVPFDINSDNGDISVTGSLDRETKDEYSITVRVTDNKHTVEKNLTIMVTDINDNVPVFEKSNYSANVTENVDTGTFVVTVVANDKDIGSNGMVTYRLDGNFSSHFNISSTGEVTVAVLIDRESIEMYDLEVIAEDQGNPRRRSTATLKIKVRDLNDNTPDFVDDKYDRKVDEDDGRLSSNSSFKPREILTVSAKDPDLYDGGMITYTIASGATNAFSVDATSGVVRSSKVLDREETISYFFVVEARDSGSNATSSTVNVTVTLLDLNDNPPRSLLENTTRTVRENATIGTTVFAELKIEDKDEGDNGRVVFSEGGDFPDKFRLDKDNGSISVARELDREAKARYEFNVNAVDQATNVTDRLNTTIRLVVRVLDVNDNFPVISPDSSGVRLDETAGIGTVVTNFSVSDPDVGNNGRLNVTLRPSGTPFTVTLIDGEAVVVLSSRLDYEKNRSHSVDLVVQDGGVPALSSSAAILVEVVNKNDEPPFVVNLNGDDIFYIEGSSDVELKPDFDITDADGPEFAMLYNSSVRLVDGEKFEVGMEPFSCPAEISNKINKIEGCGFSPIVVVTDEDNLVVQSGARLDGNTLFLDGVDDFADLKGNIADVSDGITIASWVYLDTLPSVGNEFAILSKRHPVGDGHYYTVCVLHDGKIRVRTTNTSGTQISDLTGVGSKCVGNYCMIAVIIKKYDATHWIVEVFVDGEPAGRAFVDPIVDDSGRTYVGATAAGNDPLEKFLSGQIHLLFVDVSSTGRLEFLKCIKGCGEALRTSVDDLPVGLAAAYSYDTATLTISGKASFAEYVSVLNSLVYVSDVEEPLSGTRTVSVTVSDGAFVNQLPGIITIKLALTNDNPPVLNLNGQLGANFSVVFKEDDSVGGAINITNTSGLTLTDMDRGVYAYTVEVFILNAMDGPNEVLAVGENQMFVYNNSTNVLTFTATVEASELQDILRSVTYDNTAEEPDSESRIIRFSVKDGSRQESEHVYSIVSISFVNDPPVLGLFSIVNYDEGDGRKSVNLNLTILDNDNVTLINATAFITSALDLPRERLDVNTTGTKISKSYNNATGTLSLSGEDDMTIYETVLKSLTYEHLGQNDPTPGPRMVVTRVFDGLTFSNYVEAMITFSAVNDAPIVDLNGPSVPGFSFKARFTEGSPPTTIVSTDAYIKDVDDKVLTYLNAALTSRPNGNVERLNITIPASTTLQQMYNSSTGVLAVTSTTGNASVDDFQSVLRTLTYHNAADELTGDGRNVTVVASDGRLSSLVATIAITMASSDDKPVITIPSNATATFVDSSGPVNILAENSVMITDADVNSRIQSFRFILRRVENVTLESLSFTGIDDYVVVVTKGVDWIDYNVTHNASGIDLNSAADFVEGVKYESEIDEPDAGIRRVVDIRVHDGALNSDFVNVTLNIQLINDHTPRFVQPDGYMGSVSENVSPRSVLRVVATDRDRGSDGVVRYSLRSCQCVYQIDMGMSIDPIRRDCSGSPFSVGSASGDVNTTKSLNREETSVCYIAVTAVDLGSSSMSATVNVTVTVTDRNDETPSFSDDTRFALDISEIVKVGDVAFTFTATDDDEMSTANSNVVYRIVGGTGNNTFEIPDEKVGNVTVTRSLDADPPNAITFYTLIVEAADRGSPPLTVNATFNVTVTDVDDNCPYFDPTVYSVAIQENATVGTVVQNIKVYDNDATEENRKFSTKIIEGNVGNAFTVNGTLFVLSTALDRETTSWYRVRVAVQDPAGVCDSARAWVNVTVLDFNDVRPCFEQSSYRFTVDENVTLDYTVGRILAVDGDEGSNGDVTYKLSSSTPSVFAIHPTSGVITTNGSLDREKDECFLFVVIATDKGSPSLSCSVNVTICLNDTNDHSPVFDRKNYSFNVSENEGNVTLSTVVAIDDDATEEFNVITFSLNGNSDSFSIGASSGTVFVSKELDYETRCLYDFSVVATDPTGQQATARVTVSVLDKNEHAPSFVDKNKTVDLLESAPPDGFVLRLSADDDDVCDSDMTAVNKIDYSLVDDASGVFRIASDNGSVYLVRAVDYESRQSHVITAKATDQGGLYSVCNITIRIVNVNDVAPMFVNKSYNASVNENVALGTELFIVSAVDGDLPPHNDVRYSANGAGAAYVAVGRKSGIVTVNKSIDFEVTGRAVEFDIVASDGVSSSSVPVTVTVYDLNDERPVCTVTPDDVVLSRAPAFIARDLVVSDPDTDHDDIANSSVTLSVPRCVLDLVNNTTYGTPTLSNQFGDCGAAQGVELTYHMLDFAGTYYPGYGYSFIGGYYGRVTDDLVPRNLANNFMISVCFGMYSGGRGTLVGRNSVNGDLLYRVVVDARKVSFEYSGTQGAETVDIALRNNLDDNTLRTMSLLIYYPRVTVYTGNNLVGHGNMPNPMQDVDAGPVYVGKMPSNRLAFKGYIKSAVLRNGFANFLPPYSNGFGGLTAAADVYRFDDSKKQYAQVPKDLAVHGIGSAFSVFIRINVSINDEGFLFAKGDEADRSVLAYAVKYDADHGGNPHLDFSYMCVGCSSVKRETVDISPRLDDGLWHTFGLVVDQTIAEFYVDDSPPYITFLEGIINDTNTGHAFRIGAHTRPADDDDYFDGEMSTFVLRPVVTSVEEFNCFSSGCNGTKCVSDCSRSDSPCLPESDRCVYDTVKYTQCGMKDFVDLLTVANAPRSATGHLYLNGVDWVYVADLTAFGVVPSLVNESTISVWIRVEQGDTGYVLSQYDSINVVQFAIHVGGSTIIVSFPTGRVMLNAGTALDVDAWIHVTIIVSRTNVTLLRDGVQQDTKLLPNSTETFNTDYPFRIGASLTGSGEYTGFLKGRLRGLIASTKAEDLHLIQCVSDCREYLRYSTSYLETSGLSGLSVSAQSVSNLDGETSTSGIVTTTGSLRFSGVASTGNYTSALRQIEYINLFKGTRMELRNVSCLASDPLQASDSRVSSFFVSPINTVAATLDLNNGGSESICSAMFKEDEALVRVISDDAELIDVDSEDLDVSMIEIRLENLYEDTGVEAIQYMSTLNDPAINVTVEEVNTSFIILYGTASHHDYETALERIFYINMADEPIATSRRVSFVVYDYPYVSKAVNCTVVISLDNDNRPQILLDPPTGNFSTVFTEDSDGVSIVGANVSITDADVDQVELFNITVSIVDAIDEDYLNQSSTFASLLTFVRVTNSEIVIQGPGSFIAFENALKLLSYRSTKDEPSSHTRRIRFVAFDGRHSSSAVYTFVSIEFRDDHDPVVYLGGNTVNNSVSFREGGEAIGIADAAVRITDDDTQPTQIARIVISVVDSTQDDKLSNSSAIPNSLRIEATGRGDIELSGDGLFEDYATALRRITYRDDGDEPRRLSLTVSVTVWCKKNGSVMCGMSSTLISIVAVDDHQPMFSQPVYYANVTESAVAGTSIVYVVVVDADRFTPSNPELSLTNTFDGLFRINQKGRLNLSRIGLDRETTPKYTLEVTLFEFTDDSGSAAAISSAMIEISVLDINDNPPTFANASFTASLPENAPIGHLVLQLSANDVDSTVNSAMVFSIVSSLVNLPFNVSVDTGRLTVSSSLDYERQRRYHFTVEVCDHDPCVPEFSDTANVTVDVVDVNDNAVDIQNVNRVVVLREPAVSVRVAPNGTLVDADSTSSLDRLEIKITSPRIPTEAVTVVIPTDSRVQANYSDGRRTVVISGRATAAYYETILRSIRFVDNATNLRDDNRTVSIRAIDSESTQAPFPEVVVRVVVLILNNDQPSIDLDTRDRNANDFSGVAPDDVDAPDTLSFSYLTRFTEDGDAVRLSHSSLEISDPDASAVVERAVVNLTNPLDGDSEELTVVVTSSIELSMESTKHVLILDGSAQHDDFERVLYSVRYRNTAVQPTRHPDTSFRIVSFVVNDGRHDSLPAYTYVELDNVNDVPELRIGDNGEVDHQVTYVEGNPPVLITSQDLVILDVDDTMIESANVFIDKVYDRGDEVLNVDIGSSGLTVTGNGGPLLSLGGSATLEVYATVLKSLTYKNNIRYRFI